MLTLYALLTPRANRALLVLLSQPGKDTQHHGGKRTETPCRIFTLLRRCARHVAVEKQITRTATRFLWRHLCIVPASAPHGYAGQFAISSKSRA